MKNKLQKNLDGLVQKETIRIQLADFLENASDELIEKNKDKIMSLIYVPEKTEEQDKIWDFIKKYREKLLNFIDINYE